MLLGYMENTNGQVQGLPRVDLKLIMDDDVFSLNFIKGAVAFGIFGGFVHTKQLRDVVQNRRTQRAPKC